MSASDAGALLLQLQEQRPPPPPSPPFDAAHAKGPEHFERVSGSAIVAGLVLLLGLAVLGLVLWLGGGRKPGVRKRDRLGFSVTVKEVAAEFRLSWSPRRRPFPKTPLKPLGEDGEDGGSPLYSVVWGFLGVWLAMSALFLIMAGAIEAIEVFRAEAHLFASLWILVSLALCAAWTALFRVGSFTKEEKADMAAREMEARFGQQANNGEFGNNYASPTARMPDYDRHRRTFLYVAAFVLGLAWLSAVVAAASVSAWTLPGEQYGMLLFFGPGYGLFAGWLLFAAGLSTGIAIHAQSSPEGTRPDAEALHATDNAAYVYAPSYLPVLVCGVGALVAVASRDPAQPIPALVALLVFAPLAHRPNQIALGICAAGAVLAGILVWLKRSGAWGW